MKFQNPSIHRSKVNKRTHTHRQTESNMAFQQKKKNFLVLLFQICQWFNWLFFMQTLEVMFTDRHNMADDKCGNFEKTYTKTANGHYNRILCNNYINKFIREHFSDLGIPENS